MHALTSHLNYKLDPFILYYYFTVAIPLAYDTAVVKLARIARGTGFTLVGGVDSLAKFYMTPYVQQREDIPTYQTRRRVSEYIHATS